MNVRLIKAAVRQRDGFRCVLCGMTNATHLARHGRQLEVHRVIPGSPYSAAPGVCQTLCKQCHGPQPKRPHGSLPIIRVDVPDPLKAVMERLAGQHNRKLTGECIQALEDYARAHGLWVQQQPKPDAKKES